MSDVRIQRWFEAAKMGDIAALQAMLDNGMDVDACNSNGWTALHWAASDGQAEVVELLIRAGADIDARSASGWTALHRAVWYQFSDIAEALLRAGANVDVCDAGGSRPRDLAAPSFRPTFDRIVAETQAERVRATARVRKVRRPPRPRL